MKCPKCNEELTDDFAYCPFCEFSLPSNTVKLEEIKKHIKDLLEEAKPKRKKIIAYLSNLRILTDKNKDDFVEEWQYVSENDFFDIIGYSFNLNPELFVKSLYKKLAGKIQMLYGAKKVNEMEKFILKNYSLKPGEEILLEFNEGIVLYQNPTLKTINSPRGTSGSGIVYVTNNRIILQGKLKAFQGEFSSGYPSRNRIINYSLQQHCFGYIFPTKNLFDLKKK